MNRFSTLFSKSGNAALIVSLAVAALSACATAPPPNNGPAMPPASPPAYRAGTTYVYDNGTWETVVESDNATVTWQDHRGYISAGSPDFTFRRSSWQTRTREGSRAFSPREDLLVRPPATLWPLAVGKEAGHLEMGTWRENGGIANTYQTAWSCKVTGTERISVMAGEFDTYTIVCKRYYRNRFREAKTWYYAPAVGHYVLVKTEYHADRPSRRLELMAIIPPRDRLGEKEQRRMDLSFQQALESQKSGARTEWTIPEKRLAGEIVPIDTFRLDNGTFCRRYEQKVSDPQGTERYFGMACRDATGAWVVPQR